MCMALPARLLTVDPGGTAQAEIDGRIRTVVLTALDRDAAPGDWVLVHAGLAVELLDERQALALQRLLQEARSTPP
jgi:hydrogenase expression/formation protein HypC